MGVLDWFIGWLNGWLIDWLISWLTDRSTDWLIEWSIDFWPFLKYLRYTTEKACLFMRLEVELESALSAVQSKRRNRFQLSDCKSLVVYILKTVLVYTLFTFSYFNLQLVNSERISWCKHHKQQINVSPSFVLIHTNFENIMEEDLLFLW